MEAATARAPTMTSRWARPMGERLAAPRADRASEGAPPDDRPLTRILETATTVPDHGGLRPWRFAVVTGVGRERFAEALVAGLPAPGS